MKLYIKNMVCDRCILIVESEFKKLGFHPLSVTLGEVELNENLNTNDMYNISLVLDSFGFELIYDKKKQIIEKIKSLIISFIRNTDNDMKINLSYYLEQQLGFDYHYLSNTFSEVENTTIEKFFIAQKIEYVKELLSYGELSLSDIAFRLNYSSVAYLSNQFKKITGYTPSQFRNLDNRRKPLDKV